MSAAIETFRAAAATGELGALSAATHPALLVDRAGSRIVWFNAAALALFGGKAEALLERGFAPTSPFARRIAAIAGQIGPGPGRIERLPIPVGIVPVQAVCKASRVILGAERLILVEMVDGLGRLGTAAAADAAAALAAVIAVKAAPASASEAAVTPPPASIEATPAAPDAAPDAAPADSAFAPFIADAAPDADATAGAAPASDTNIGDGVDISPPAADMAPTDAPFAPESFNPAPADEAFAVADAMASSLDGTPPALGQAFAAADIGAQPDAITAAESGALPVADWAPTDVAPFPEPLPQVTASEAPLLDDLRNSWIDAPADNVAPAPEAQPFAAPAEFAPAEGFAPELAADSFAPVGTGESQPLDDLRNSWIDAPTADVVPEATVDNGPVGVFDTSALTQSWLPDPGLGNEPPGWSETILPGAEAAFEQLAPAAPVNDTDGWPSPPAADIAPTLEPAPTFDQAPSFETIPFADANADPSDLPAPSEAGNPGAWLLDPGLGNAASGWSETILPGAEAAFEQPAPAAPVNDTDSWSPLPAAETAPAYEPAPYVDQAPTFEQTPTFDPAPTFEPAPFADAASDASSFIAPSEGTNSGEWLPDPGFGNEPTGWSETILPGAEAAFEQLAPAAPVNDAESWSTPATAEVAPAFEQAPYVDPAPTFEPAAHISDTNSWLTPATADVAPALDPAPTFEPAAPLNDADSWSTPPAAEVAPAFEQAPYGEPAPSFDVTPTFDPAPLADVASGAASLPTPSEATNPGESLSDQVLPAADPLPSLASEPFAGEPLGSNEANADFAPLQDAFAPVADNFAAVQDSLLPVDGAPPSDEAPATDAFAPVIDSFAPAPTEFGLPAAVSDAAENLAADVAGFVGSAGDMQESLPASPLDADFGDGTLTDIVPPLEAPSISGLAAEAAAALAPLQSELASTDAATDTADAIAASIPDALQASDFVPVEDLAPISPMASPAPDFMSAAAPVSPEAFDAPVAPVMAREPDYEPAAPAVTEPEGAATADGTDAPTDTTAASVAPADEPEPAAPQPAGLASPAEPESPEAPASPVEPAFAFDATPRNVRFVFELDEAHRFTFLSPDLGATLGPAMADVAGASWGDVAARFGFDAAGRLDAAFRRKDTFTGLTVDWPVEGAALRVPVDLAGMPVFGRDRVFRGHRGFGVIKCGAAFPAAPVAPTGTPDETAETPAAGEVAADPAAPLAESAFSNDAPEAAAFEPAVADAAEVTAAPEARTATGDDLGLPPAAPFFSSDDAFTESAPSATAADSLAPEAGSVAAEGGADPSAFAGDLMPASLIPAAFVPEEESTPAADFHADLPTDETPLRTEAHEPDAPTDVNEAASTASEEPATHETSSAAPDGAVDAPAPNEPEQTSWSSAPVDEFAPAAVPSEDIAPTFEPAPFIAAADRSSEPSTDWPAPADEPASDAPSSAAPTLDAGDAPAFTSAEPASDLMDGSAADVVEELAPSDTASTPDAVLPEALANLPVPSADADSEPASVDAAIAEAPSVEDPAAEQPATEDMAGETPEDVADAAFVAMDDAALSPDGAAVVDEPFAAPTEATFAAGATADMADRPDDAAAGDASDISVAEGAADVPPVEPVMPDQPDLLDLPGTNPSAAISEDVHAGDDHAGDDHAGDDHAEDGYAEDDPVVDDRPADVFASPATAAERPAEVADLGGDLEFVARSAEVIASPIIARPVQTPIVNDEEAARRRLSRPEREAFQKIAEALGARYADGVPPEGDEPSLPAAATPPQRPFVANPRFADLAAEPDSLPGIDLDVLDKLPVAVAILKDGEAVHLNRAFLDLTGFADLAEVAAAGGFSEIFAGAAVPREAASPALRRRDGVEVPVAVRFHSIPWIDRVASLLVIQETATTTGRDRAEAAEARVGELEAILDTATDGVLVLDGGGTVVGANRSSEALFGLPRERMVGAPLVDLLAPESHRGALDYLDGLTRNGVASVLNDGREVIGKVAQGGLVPLFMTMGRVSSSKFCAVLRDITQWKRAEEELTSAKRSAETASSQKSDFLAKISHEIRTPLNAIIGFSEVMMEERFGPVGSDRYKGYLRDIHLSGAHIMSLVNDLLDLSKIEAGKLDLSFEAVPVNDVVRECVALMQPQANRERVIIRTALSSSLPAVVADNRSLRQIVLNLVSNAIKFNSAGGQVIVSTIFEETGEVSIRVRDTGPGMSSDDIVKALEPFRQLHTARRGRGTGLGLPLTKALVEANRAAFRIDSTVGHGTLVQITFPSTRVLAE